MIDFLIIFLAFFCEYIDSVLGGGYGTILTPVLLAFGFNPLIIVPSILFSELITGITSGLTHHSVGNVDLFSKQSLKSLGPITGFSIIGSIIAVFTALSVPKLWLNLYIGFLLSFIGLFLLINKDHKFNFSSKKISLLGLLAGFNKGLSGGGYGPLVTSGQVLSGVDDKAAVGITSFAEGLVCVVGFTLYFILNGFVFNELLISLLIGSLLSVPFTAFTVKVVDSSRLRRLISLLTFVLGARLLFKFGGQLIF